YQHAIEKKLCTTGAYDENSAVELSLILYNVLSDMLGRLCATFLPALNDVLADVDSWGTVILTLLDQSVALDTIDHLVLLDRLESRFGMDGIAHRWFQSVLPRPIERSKNRSIKIIDQN
ncbi:hypothetical protein OUZ56_017036, partial [Daphnia magna]